MIARYFRRRNRSIDYFTMLSRRQFSMNASSPTVIILAGPTGVGKSAVARQLCSILDAEIVIADCVQVYKYLDIGSNKPSKEEVEQIRHHLLGIENPDMQLSAGDFVDLAVPAIADIISRGKIPLVVGGSTMWLQWLVHGKPDAPRVTTATRERASSLVSVFKLNTDNSAAENWSAAMNALSMYDPQRMGSLCANDWYRCERYLEIALAKQELHNEDSSSGATSVTCSSTSGGCTETGGESLTGVRSSVFPSHYDVRCFFINEQPREKLYRHIDARCVEMLRDGLLQETAEVILNKYITPGVSLVAKSIGYRQAIDYLLKDKQKGDVDSFVDFVRIFAAATRNYARDQNKWYRKDNGFLFVQMNRMDNKKVIPMDKGTPSKDLTPYNAVATEILHWCDQPKEVFQQLIDQQLLNGGITTNALKTGKRKNPPSAGEGTVDKSSKGAGRVQKNKADIDEYPTASSLWTAQDLAVRQGKHDSHTLKTYINNFSSKNMGPKGVDFSRDISTSFLNSLLAEADGISEKVKNFLSKEKDGNSSSGGSSSS